MSSGSGPLASVTRSGDGILQQPAPLCHSLPGGHPRSEASPPRQSRSNAGEILRLRPQDDKPAGWLPTPPFVMLSLSEASPYAGCHSNAGEILRVRAQDDKAQRGSRPRPLSSRASARDLPLVRCSRTQERSFACALRMTRHTGWLPVCRDGHSQIPKFLTPKGLGIRNRSRTRHHRQVAPQQRRSACDSRVPGPPAAAAACHRRCRTPDRGSPSGSQFPNS